MAPSSRDHATITPDHPKSDTKRSGDTSALIKRPQRATPARTDIDLDEHEHELAARRLAEPVADEQTFEPDDFVETVDGGTESYHKDDEPQDRANDNEDDADEIGDLEDDDDGFGDFDADDEKQPLDFEENTPNHGEHARADERAD